MTEAFALADPEVRQALQAPIDRLRRLLPGNVRETSLADVCNDAQAADLAGWFDTFCTVQWGEIDSSLGAWIAAARPQFGPRTAAGLELVQNLDRSRLGAAARRRERFYRQLERSSARAICSASPRRRPSHRSKEPPISTDSGAITSERLSLTALAGLGRLPQVSLPLATVSGAPIGLSLLAARGDDLRLLEFAALTCRGGSS